MDINEKDLRERYEALDTDELIELCGNTELTELAKSVLKNVLGERGVDWDAFQERVGKQEKEEKTPEGIGGWLILVAIGIVVTPIRLIIIMMATYPEIFSTGTWEALTTQGGEAYSPLWAPIIFGEILINSGILLTWLYIAYLFFSKKLIFPKWYIGLAVFSLVFIIADAFAIKLLIPSEPVFDPDTIKEFMRSLFAVVVWVPYMLISKRVKATFVNE